MIKQHDTKRWVVGMADLITIASPNNNVTFPLSKTDCHYVVQTNNSDYAVNSNDCCLYFVAFLNSTPTHMKSVSLSPFMAQTYMKSFHRSS